MTTFSIICGLIALVFLARAVNLFVLIRWYARPQPPGSTVVVNGLRVYYTLKGEGSPVVVISPDLGAASPEWWQIQDELSRWTTVLTYDRAGYGWSELPSQRRTGRQIAEELASLLDELNINDQVVLVGHSLGGLYVNHFSRMYPGSLAGAVFIDPMSPDDRRFANELPPRVYKRSGADKRQSLKLQTWLTGFGVLRLMKPALLKAPAFKPFKKLPDSIFRLVWNNLLMPKTAQTSRNEYAQAHNQQNSVDLRNPEGFPNIPVRVITHSSALMTDQFVRTRGLTLDEAKKVEDLWQELIRSYGSLSNDSRVVEAEHSGHLTHLEQPDLVVNTVRELVDEVRRTPPKTPSDPL